MRFPRLKRETRDDVAPRAIGKTPVCERSLTKCETHAASTGRGTRVYPDVTIGSSAGASGRFCSIRRARTLAPLPPYVRVTRWPRSPTPPRPRSSPPPPSRRAPVPPAGPPSRALAFPRMRPRARATPSAPRPPLPLLLPALTSPLPTPGVSNTNHLAARASTRERPVRGVLLPTRQPRTDRPLGVWEGARRAPPLRRLPHLGK